MAKESAWEVPARGGGEVARAPVEGWPGSERTPNTRSDDALRRAQAWNSLGPARLNVIAGENPGICRTCSK